MRERLDKALAQFETQTAIPASLVVGPVEGTDARTYALGLLARVAPAQDAAAVLILVSPGDRVVEIVTTARARRRVTDDAAALATLAMTTSFGVGDLVGGMVGAIRQLADSAGRTGLNDLAPVPAPGSPALHAGPVTGLVKSQH